MPEASIQGLGGAGLGPLGAMRSVARLIHCSDLVGEINPIDIVATLEHHPALTE